jgi:hypothetical protein
MSYEHKLKLLEHIAEKYNYSLSHFLVPTVQRSGVEGIGRFNVNFIPKDTIVAIIGGIIVDEPDQLICMPIGNHLYLHQVHSLFRATTNHSCEPNCRIQGFNTLVSIRDITPQEELTVDYGTVSVGNGRIIIDSCQCGNKSCRGQIKTDDYLHLPLEQLAAYPKYMRETDVDD